MEKKIKLNTYMLLKNKSSSDPARELLGNTFLFMVHIWSVMLLDYSLQFHRWKVSRNFFFFLFWYGFFLCVWYITLWIYTLKCYLKCQHFSLFFGERSEFSIYVFLIFFFMDREVGHMKKQNTLFLCFAMVI